MNLLPFKIFFLFFILSNIGFSQDNDSVFALIHKNKTKELSKEECLFIIDYLVENGQYANGLTYCNQLEKLCIKTSDTSNLVKSINLKAGNLFDLGKTQEGIDFCEKMEKYFRPQDSVQMELLCFKWGMLYYKNKDYTKALEKYYTIKTPRYRALHIFNNNLSIIYAKMAKYDSAIHYIQKNITPSNTETEKHISYLNIGYYSLLFGAPKIALMYLDSAKNNLSQNSSYSSFKTLYSNYYETYKALKLTKGMVRALDSVSKYNDLIFNQKMDEKIHEIENSNSRENNLKKKVKNIDNKIEKYERQFTLSAIVIVLLIALIIFYFVYRNIRTKNKLINLEQNLLRSQMTPHFIFNSLSVVQGMILNSEKDKAVSYLSKFSKLMRLILENSRDKLVSLEDELTAVSNYLDLQMMQMKKPLTYSINIDKNIDKNELQIPPMIIQPFVENCVEHAFKGNIENPEIIIFIKIIDKNVEVQIIDNGLGINIQKEKNSQKKSVSTKITAERLEILTKTKGGKSSIELIDRKEDNKQGTKVIITLPKI